VLGLVDADCGLFGLFVVVIVVVDVVVVDVVVLFLLLLSAVLSPPRPVVVRAVARHKALKAMRTVSLPL
jgi:hypothetical protein